MSRFDGNRPCPNCGGGAHLPQGHGVRCWGMSFNDYFICTREESSQGCKELDTGFLHSYGNCFCGKPHDGTQATVLQPIRPERANQNREYAEQIWDESIDPEGTSTQDYLLSRGIEILSDQIRHHPALAHTPSGLWSEAMVVRVSDYANRFMGVERHFIDRGAKAFETQSKMTLGSIAGGSVKLANLNGTGVLGVAEGVVTALTLNQALGIPVWACLGAKNLHNIKLPPQGIINTVKVFTDGDQDGEKAMDRAGDLWLNQGYDVRSCVAPPGTDYNDLLKEGVL